MKNTSRIVNKICSSLLIAALGLGLFQLFATSNFFSTSPFHTVENTQFHSIPKNHLPSHGYIVTEVVEEEEALEHFKFIPKDGSLGAIVSYECIRDIHDSPTRENVDQYWRIKNRPTEPYFILYEDFRC